MVLAEPAAQVALNHRLAELLVKTLSLNPCQRVHPELCTTMNAKKWQLPYPELEFTFVRSRGPGGQNVNKTNSACQLRWNILSTSAFAIDDHQRILNRLANQLTNDGDLIIRNDEFRDQDANKKACIEKLIQIIEKALFVPKFRKKTKPKKSAIRKRLKEKEIRSEIKSSRKKNWD